MLLYEKKVDDIKGVYGTLDKIPADADELLIESEELRYKKWFNDGKGGIKDENDEPILVVVDGEVIVPKDGEKPEPPVEPIEPVETAASDAEANASIFAANVYNKAGTSQTITRENNEYVANNYYVAVAENVPDDAKVDLADTLKLSVGNNSFVEDVCYYIEDGKLYVAFPAMLIEGVTVDGETVFDASSLPEIAITGAQIKGEGIITQDGNNYTVDVIKRNSYVNFGLEGTEQDEPALTKKIIDSTSITYGFAKLDEKVDDTPAMGYYVFGWASTEAAWNDMPDTKTTDYTIYVPNKGKVNVFITARKGADIPVEDDGEEIIDGDNLVDDEI